MCVCVCVCNVCADVCVREHAALPCVCLCVCVCVLMCVCACACSAPLQVPPEYGSVLEASYKLPGHLATGVSADVLLTFTPKVHPPVPGSAGRGFSGTSSLASGCLSIQP